MPIFVELTSLDAPICVRLQLGDAPDPNSSSVPCTGIVVKLDDERVPFQGTFDGPLQIPRLLLIGDPTRDNILKLHSAGELTEVQRKDVEATIQAAQDEWSDRMLVDSQATFLGRAVVNARVSVGIDLLKIAGFETSPAWPSGAPVEFRLYASGQIQGTNLSRAIEFVVPILSDIPELCVSLPALGLKLPSISLPGLSWPTLELDRIELAFPKLPHVDLGLGISGAVRTVLADTLGKPWLTLEAAALDLRHEDAVLATVRNLMVRWDAGGAPQLTVGQVETPVVSVNGGTGTTSSGLLEAGWTGLAAQVVWHGTGGAGLKLRLSTERLWLCARADPSAVIAVRGSVVVSSAGVEPDGLELLEPTALGLQAHLEHRLAPVTNRFCAVAFKLNQGAREVAGKLLATFARILAAIERAAGELALAAAGLVARLLQGLRELADAVALPFDVTFELRFTTDPIALVQVAIIGPRGDRGYEAAGLTLSMYEGTEPAAEDQQGLRPFLLVDLTRPGVYAGVRLASGSWICLATDLWLDKGTGTHDAIRATIDEPAPDTGTFDSQAGGRGPLLAINLKRTSGKPLALVLAGVEDGNVVFLRRLPGVAAGNGLLPELPGVARLGPGELDIRPSFRLGHQLPFLSRFGAAAQQLADTLGQHVRIAVAPATQAGDISGGALQVPLALSLTFAGLSTEILGIVDLDVETFTARLRAAGSGPIVIEGAAKSGDNLLGLNWNLTPAKPAQGSLDAGKGALFVVLFDGGDLRLTLAPGASLQLNYARVSSGGRGITFTTRALSVSRAGLDLDADVVNDPVVLNGMSESFHFTSGQLCVRGGQLQEAAISGKGRLPPDLVGEAPVDVKLRFGSRGQGFELLSAAADLTLKQPIKCEQTNFQLSISRLGFTFVNDDGDLHFYFLVTGKARFDPKGKIFESGLLKFLPEIEIELDQAPLAADARVLAAHIKFQVPIKPRRKFNLFNVFGFELRGIGFHPAHPAFGGDPAISLSGQVQLTDLGYIEEASIEFHSIDLARGLAGSALPRIHCEGLAVKVGLAQGIRIAGAVAAAHGHMPESAVPAELKQTFKAEGFLGQGEVAIDGFATMSAAFGFLEVERADGERKRAFFLYLQRNRLSYEIPTPVWPLYLREVGFGFGYRYTLAGIKAVENSRSVAKLIETLDSLSQRQGELAKYAAWVPDVEGDDERLTLAVRGAFTLASASEREKYNASGEKELPNPFMFDIVAALRSDMTFLMVARAWLSVNYADFESGGSDVREHPLGIGYLLLSAPRSEFLARIRNVPDGYIGEHPPLPEPFKLALRSARYSATLYIRPGLFHYELGWPNQLQFSFEQGPVTVHCTAGFVFRIADGVLLQGAALSARARLAIGGSAGGGSISLSASAVVDFACEARLIAAIDTRRVSDTMFYGLWSFETAIAISVSAHMHIDLWIGSIDIDIGFSFSVQVSGVVEFVVTPKAIGARGVYRVAISVFGCTFGVSLGLGFNEDALADARVRVQRYMELGLTAEAPSGDAALTKGADDNVAQAAHSYEKIEARASQTAKPAAGAGAGEAAAIPTASGAGGSGAAATIRAGSFAAGDWLWIARRADRISEKLATFNTDPGDEWFHLLLVPRPKPGAGAAAFYAVPPAPNEERLADYQIEGAVPAGLYRFEPPKMDALGQWQPGKWNEVDSLQANPISCRTAWARTLHSGQTEAERQVTIQRLFEQAFVIENYTRRDALGEPSDATVPRRVEGHDDQARARKRHAATREFEASRVAHTADRRAHDAREFALAQVFSDFESYAESGGDEPGLHALGLSFAIRRRDLESGWQALEKMVVRRCVGPDTFVPSGAAQPNARFFNPPMALFDAPGNAPDLADLKSELFADGVRFDWNLVLGTATQQHVKALAEDGQGVAGGDESFLHHYRVERSIEGGPWHDVAQSRVKPVSTFGMEGELGYLQQGDWKISDGLEDLSPIQRKALLPPKDPAQSLDVQAAWSQAFGQFAGGERVTLAYRFTPRDVGGASGIPVEHVVNIERPRSPLHAAQAELVFELLGMTTTGELGQPQAGNAGLRAFIALQDDHWKPLKQANSNGVGAPARQDGRQRGYRLFLQFQDTLPIGSYGAGGLTTPPSAQVGGSPDGAAAANESWIDFTWDRLEQLRELRANFPGAAGERQAGLRACPLEGTIDTTEPADFLPLALSMLWPAERPEQVLGHGEPLRPAGRDLLACLREGLGDAPAAWQHLSRAACRFYLQTWVKITPRENGQAPYRLWSARMPVSFEMRLFPERMPGGPLAMRQAIRPEFFEWPVKGPLPGLLRSDLDVRTGFLARWMPSVADGSACLHQLDVASVLLRDPARRIATDLRWAAIPRRLGANPALGALVAGYELREIDADELPPGSFAKCKGAIEAHYWRRVAQVTLLPQDQAALVPADTTELGGWTAAYPSDTWRATREESNAKPMPTKRAWPSPADSTLMWPAPMVRRSLVVDLDPLLVDGLFARGVPAKIRLSLRCKGMKVTVEAAPLLRHLGEETLKQVPGAARSEDQVWTFSPRTLLGLNAEWLAGVPEPDLKSDDCGLVVHLGPPAAWVDLVRRTLLALRWNDDVCRELDKELDTAASPTPFPPGLALHIESLSGPGDVLVEQTVPIAGSTLHPVIEEMLHRLRYATVNGGTLARTCVPELGKRMTPPTRDFLGLLSATPVDRDPYGWGVLQMLGLASTVRLFNTVTGSFEAGGELLNRIDESMARVRRLYGEAAWSNAGDPIVEVLLQPLADLEVLPFDAAAGTGAVPAPEGLLSQRALAMAQVSLRPRVVPAFTFKVLRLRKGNQPKGAITNAGLTVTIRQTAEKSPCIRVTMPSPPNDPKPWITLAEPEGRRVQTLQEQADPEVVWQLPDAKGTPPAGSWKLQANRLEDGSECWHLAVAFWPSNWAVQLSFEADDPSWWVDVADHQLFQRNPAQIEPARWAKDDNALIWGRFDVPEPSRWALAYLQPTRTAATVSRLGLDRLAAHLSSALSVESIPGIGSASIVDASAVAAVAAWVNDYHHWAGRFFAHGALPWQAPQPVSNGNSMTPLAIATPSAQEPMRLAAAQGVVRMVRVHQDRWAHQRLYAVQPVSRYAHLIKAAEGIAATEDPAAPLEFVEAVTPRTESVLPPMILSSLRVDVADGSAGAPGTDGVDGTDAESADATEADAATPGVRPARPGRVWELVVQEHGEQQLAESNRAVAARLEFGGLAFAFMREYLYPAWRRRWADDLMSGRYAEAAIELVPDEAHVPASDATWEGHDEPPPEVLSPESFGSAEGAVDEVVVRSPRVRNGARIYRIPGLPFHRAVHLFAVARAGIVVSPVVGATQRDFAYRIPPIAPPEVTLMGGSEGTDRGISVSLTLLRHRDLMESDVASRWVVPGSVDDLPDSELAYELALISGEGPKTLASVEAELVPNRAADMLPLTVRLPGPAWSSAQPPAGVDGPIDLRCVRDAGTLTWRASLRLSLPRADAEQKFQIDATAWPTLKEFLFNCDDVAQEHRWAWSIIAPRAKADLRVQLPPAADDDPGWQALAQRARAVRSQISAVALALPDDLRASATQLRRLLALVVAAEDRTGRHALIEKRNLAGLVTWKTEDLPQDLPRDLPWLPILAIAEEGGVGVTLTPANTTWPTHSKPWREDELLAIRAALDVSVPAEREPERGQAKEMAAALEHWNFIALGGGTFQMGARPPRLLWTGSPAVPDHVPTWLRVLVQATLEVQRPVADGLEAWRAALVKLQAKMQPALGPDVFDTMALLARVGAQSSDTDVDRQWIAQFGNVAQATFTILSVPAASDACPGGFWAFHCTDVAVAIELLDVPSQGDYEAWIAGLAGAQLKAAAKALVAKVLFHGAHSLRLRALRGIARPADAITPLLP